MLGASAPKTIRMRGKYEYTSPLDAELWEAWAKRAGDPETQVPHWIREGAPLGIEKAIGTCGIFPANVEGEREECKGPGELGEPWANMGDVTNYSSVTEDPVNARIELDRYKELGYMKVVPIQEAERDMGHGTVSRLGRKPRSPKS